MVLTDEDHIGRAVPDGGRYPRNSKLTAEEFAQMAETCLNPPKPSDRLMEILRRIRPDPPEVTG